MSNVLELNLPNWYLFELKKIIHWTILKRGRIKFLPFTYAYFTLQLLASSDFTKNYSFASWAFTCSSTFAWNFWQKENFLHIYFLVQVLYKTCQKTLSQFAAERLKGEKDELLVGGRVFECFPSPFPITFNGVGISTKLSH